MTGPSDPYVIVGGGQAGAWIARTLRDDGFAGRILIIAAEAHWPYERPPLSKAFLQGTADAASLTLLDETQAATLGIECWRGCTATRIDRDRRRVVCADGRSPGYDKLFLTTGGQARTLPWLHGIASERIHMLRTQADALRLRAALDGGNSLLVVGGGWIGLEVAATARAMGKTVTLVEAASRLCARTVPPIVSDFLRNLHESQGVTIRTGHGVTGLVADGSGVTLILATGEKLRADHALIGIGIAPETTLAASCGLAIEDGILVDRQGRTSDPDIFAAGDVARHPSRFIGGMLRLESWANAQNQAIVAAKASLGGADVYDDVPWLWSDQYATNLQILGVPSDATDAVARGTPEAGSGCWLMRRADGTAAGAVAVNAPRELRALRKLLSEGRTPCPVGWADPNTKLQSLPTLD